MAPRLLILLLAALLAFVPAACGGDDEEDADELLRQTFTGDKQVDSGRLSLSAAVSGDGGGELPGPLELTVAGPFQRIREDDLPRFDLDATLRATGMTLELGAISTADSGYIGLEGDQYRVTDEVFGHFRDGFRDARARRSGADRDVDLATLGIDPRKWLENARVAGEAQVGEAQTTRIVGDVDVPELLADLARAHGRADEPGRRRGRSKDAGGLTPERRREIAEEVEAMSIEIFTGEEDRILRRLVLEADLRSGRSPSSESPDARLDYSITELNRDQQIEAPRDPRPFRELERRLRRLGIR